jgi:ketopantoate reductase
MKVVVLGAGAVGCYVGGLLSLAGFEVAFAVRPAARDTLAARGVHLCGPRGDFHAAGIGAATGSMLRCRGGVCGRDGTRVRRHARPYLG